MRFVLAILLVLSSFAPAFADDFVIIGNLAINKYSINYIEKYNHSVFGETNYFIVISYGAGLLKNVEYSTSWKRDQIFDTLINKLDSARQNNTPFKLR